MKKISFAQEVKEEIVSNQYESLTIKKAILCGYIRVNGTILIRNKHSLLTLNNENAKISKFVYNLILDLFQADTHLSYSKNNRRRTLYTITINSKVEEILNDLDINFLEGKVSKIIVYDNETIAAYLTGVFLACGSINSPKTSNYHLEFALNNENYAKWVSRLFGRYKNNTIEPKIITRRNKSVIYFKKSDQIADFLVMINTMNSVMEFENIRIDRDYTNNANRLTNLDTANMSKTIEAGKRQAHEIKYLIKKIGLENIGDKKTQLVAKIREEYISISLEEIKDMLNDNYGYNVTKSNINHIFRRIHNLYLKEKI